jgi:hypothetical protein
MIGTILSLTSSTDSDQAAKGSGWQGTAPPHICESRTWVLMWRGAMPCE